MESRADRRTSRALHTVTTHANASDRPTYFIGELRLSVGQEYLLEFGLRRNTGDGRIAARFRLSGLCHLHPTECRTEKPLVARILFLEEHISEVYRLLRGVRREYGLLTVDVEQVVVVGIVASHLEVEEDLREIGETRIDGIQRRPERLVADAVRRVGELREFGVRDPPCHGRVLLAPPIADQSHRSVLPQFVEHGVIGSTDGSSEVDGPGSPPPAPRAA